MNLNIKAEGENEHHKIEGIFKALARSIKMAVKRDIYKYELPSTKGYYKQRRVKRLSSSRLKQKTITKTKEMKAYVFPGQGAQFTGMGKDLYDQSPGQRII